MDPVPKISHYICAKYSKIQYSNPCDPKHFERYPAYNDFFVFSPKTFSIAFFFLEVCVVLKLYITELFVLFIKSD